MEIIKKINIDKKMKATIFIQLIFILSIFNNNLGYSILNHIGYSGFFLFLTQVNIVFFIGLYSIFFLLDNFINIFPYSFSGKIGEMLILKMG